MGYESIAPDVVYSFTPSADIVISCGLCDSSYDTKLYVYADSVGNLVACNDDGCFFEYQSAIVNLALEAEMTFIRQLARANKLIQGIFVARKTR